MNMGCVSSYHPGGERAPVFDLWWKLREVEVHCNSQVLGIYSADNLYSGGLTGNVFQDRSINGWCLSCPAEQELTICKPKHLS